VVAKETHVVESEAYLKGLVDKSLFASYEDHVVRQLWNCVVSNNVYIYALKLICYLLYFNYEIIFIGYCRIVMGWNWCLMAEKWISWECHMNK